MRCRGNDSFCSLYCTTISLPHIVYILQDARNFLCLILGFIKKLKNFEGHKAMTAELESLVGTFLFTALQTHSKVFFSRTKKLHIHVHFKNPCFQHKLFLVFISNSSPKLTVSCIIKESK